MGIALSTAAASVAVLFFRASFAGLRPPVGLGGASMSDRPSSTCPTSFSCETLLEDISHAWKRAEVGEGRAGRKLTPGAWSLAAAEVDT